MKISGKWCYCLLTSLLLTSLVCAQEAKEPSPAEAATAPVAAPRAQEGDPKPYDKVITKDARTQKGVFIVHWVKSKVYYEIPTSQLGKDFLWESLIAKTTLGVGNGGQSLGRRVVRWELREHRVLLRSVSFDIVADESLPIAKAVHASNNDSVLMSFAVEALASDKSPVIEVTKLFATEVPEFSARVRLRARGFDASRSFIERIAAYPQNIEVEATQTYTCQLDQPACSQPAPGGMQPGSATLVMHYSMLKLPERPMQPRLADERLGYYSMTQADFGRDEHKAAKRAYILRWRLEKKDPAAALSEPVKPIVFYIDPATPERWRPWLKKGIQDWQPAFEAAGFKNAIIAKDPPSPEEDPQWSTEDLRYSVVHWLPSETENANGGRRTDPRSGEILSAAVSYYHNIMNLMRDMYFIQVGPLDARAQKLPLSDELMGRLLEYVVAHEVGHTLGFMHNMKSSSLYPAEKVRDKEWVHKMGHVATLMDYSRFNYVAQPEDHIPPEDLIPVIGPYDKWATMWGYKPIPGATTADDEKKTLDEWARQQDSTPWLRFSSPRSNGSDWGENTEAVGDADAVYATGLGIKNLRRVMELLPVAAVKPGEPYDDLAEIYGRALGQWVTEMNHVTAIIGGADTQEKYAGQAGVSFTPLPKRRQIEAVAFLNQNAFQTPTFFIRPEILRQIEPVGVLTRIQKAQTTVLGRVLDNARLSRLIEFDALDRGNSYRPLDFLAAVRKGVWSELYSPNIRIDVYRRNLQRSYVELLARKINAAAAEDVRPYFRGQLRLLDTEIASSLPKTADAETRMHLQDTRAEIAKALDPKFAQAAVPPARQGQGGLRDDDSDSSDALGCWPDYIINADRVPTSTPNRQD